MRPFIIGLVPWGAGRPRQDSSQTPPREATPQPSRGAALLSSHPFWPTPPAWVQGLGFMVAWSRCHSPTPVFGPPILSGQHHLLPETGVGKRGRLSFPKSCGPPEYHLRSVKRLKKKKRLFLTYMGCPLELTLVNPNPYTLNLEP